MQTDLTTHLVEYRQKHGLTQADLASALGIKFRTYQTIETTGQTKKTADETAIQQLTGWRETQKIAQSVDNKADYTAETIRDLARSGVVLAEANKSLANNNTELIDMLKRGPVSSNSPQRISEFLEPYLRQVAAGLAKRFSIKESDLDVEIGSILTDSLAFSSVSDKSKG